MKKMIISIIAFICLILSMNFSLKYLNNVTMELESKNDLLEELIVNEDWDKSYDEVISLLDFIDENSTKMSIFINHQEINSIESEVFKLTQYVKSKTYDESLASIHYIKFSVKNINRLQKINIENIF
ncbi:DUF4363 family protein [Clostridium frigidicarnis]|uniref:DUF4363 family protein n=1 Tax=Clostridium frigidicarnis TaxID=84698 RepID=A0A1I1AEV8_9CLOT|nr:DUF4363 family protein [Clostridium frigidicarnis]SFB36022.1 protein of unknown function [Clostridium frigidicarnis]